MNSITVIGNVGQDPEIQYFESGSSKCRFTLADRQRQKDAPPIWWSVEVWGKLAVTAADYLKKGSKVAVSGSVKQDSWTSKEGAAKTKLVLDATRMEFLGGKPAEENEQPQVTVASVAAAVATPAAPSEGLDSIPF